MKEQKVSDTEAAAAEASYGNNFIPYDNGWIKAVRSVQVKSLMAKSHSMMCLLWIIALRAWRGPGINGYGCGPGEAFIGDCLTLGFTQKSYRVCKRQLEKLGKCSFRATNKGTIAKLLTVDIFDINLDEAVTDRIQKGKQGASQGQTEGNPGANEGQAEGKQGATNKNERSKEVKNERKKEDNNSAAGADAGVVTSPPSAGELEALPDAEQYEEPQTPSQKAVELSRELPLFVKRTCGYNQLPVFTRTTLDETREFFERNTDFKFWDIIAICALGMKLSREHPAPEKGVDPYWFSRRFAGRPNKLFDTTTEDDLYLARMIKEVKYEVDGDHDMDWANELFQSELKRAMKPSK